jgi:hypothetical protein
LLGKLLAEETWCFLDGIRAHVRSHGESSTALLQRLKQWPVSSFLRVHGLLQNQMHLQVVVLSASPGCRRVLSVVMYRSCRGPPARQAEICYCSQMVYTARDNQWSIKGGGLCCSSAIAKAVTAGHCFTLQMACLYAACRCAGLQTSCTPWLPSLMRWQGHLCPRQALKDLGPHVSSQLLFWVRV